MTGKMRKMIKLAVKYHVNKNCNGCKAERELLTTQLTNEQIVYCEKLIKQNEEMKIIKNGVTNKAVRAREVTDKVWQYTNARFTINLVETLRQKMSLLPNTSEEYHRYQFLLKYGLYWSTGQKPDCYESMQIKECYHNSFIFCTRNPEFAYFEGLQRLTYDGDDELISHAWCVEQDNNLIDATFPAPNACEYIGIPLILDFVKNVFEIHGSGTNTISAYTPYVDIKTIKPEEIIDKRYLDILI